jgi:phospholipase C
MPEVTRRHLLSSAAAGAGGLLASSFLPPALARAAALGPRKGNFGDVEHVVIHMQENRSFDHYFGTLTGVRGFGDKRVQIQSNGQSVFYQPDPYNPDGYLLPWHLDTQTTSAQAIPSTSHAWTVQHEAVNITVGTPTTATNNNWIPAHYAADGTSRYGYVMGYYERQDVPFHFALAEAFTLCDAYHCSLLGPTWPNRMYLMTGWNDPNGLYGGPMISNTVPSPTTGKPYTWTTYPELLTGAGISWRVYQEEDDYGCNPLKWFQNFQDATPGSALYENGLVIHAPDRFEWDVKNNQLPTVSWIIPTSGQSEHPAYLPASGSDFVASKLNAVASNPDVWNSTVYILNYDENDGLFDHVTPPLPRAGTADEFIDGLPIGGGIRVPAFIISPWSVGGFVATEQFDHTSVIQLLETLTGVVCPNISPWRRETFGDLTSALGFSRGRTSTYPKDMPNTIKEFWAAEQEATTLPAAAFPGAEQTAPVQEKWRVPLPWITQVPPTVTNAAPKALPATTSRFQENKTSHRSDFADGSSDRVYLARLAAVEGAPTASATSYAYIPGIVGGAIAIFDVASQSLASAITSGTTNAYGAAATPDGTQVWVTESGANTVSVIDTATNTIASSVVVGVYPHGVAISPDQSTALVANTGPNTGPGGSQTISVIDVATATLADTIVVGEAPMKVTYSPDGSQAFVTCATGLYAIATAGLTATNAPTALDQPHGVAVTPDGSEAWVTDTANNQILVFDSASLAVKSTIPVGQTPWNVTFSADGTAAYVTNANDNTVSLIDTSSYAVSTIIPLGGTAAQLNQIPTGIGTAPDGSIWVACNVSSSVAIISGDTVSTSLEIALGDSPTEIAFT